MFHFGGKVPSPEVISGRRAFPRFPEPTQDEGKGLAARDIPDVKGAKAQWITQLDHLARADGADSSLLEEVRGWILHGVKSVFKGAPPVSRRMQNSGVFQKNLPLCMERLKVYRDYRALRALSGLPPPGAHIQPLHAVIKPGKKARICVDLSRNFNDFVEDQKFRMSSVQSAVDLAQEAGGSPHFVKLDLSACFLSFPIHEDDLRFFYCEAGGDFFQFVTLVFGRKDAPRAATLLLDVVSASLSDQGIAHVRYLDDFFLVGSSSYRVWACAHRAAKVIADFGLSLSLPKVEGPSQRMEFLGIVIDSRKKTLSISTERHKELMGLLQAFGKRRTSSVTRLQSLLGKLSFAATVLPGARPFLRRIIDSISDTGKGKFHLDAGFREEVRYWRDHLADWNGRQQWLHPSTQPFVVASDASTSGFAYGMEQLPPGVTWPPGEAPGAVRMGVWSAAKGDATRQQHSANIQWGEFFCTLAAAVEFGPKFRNSHVVFVIDNEADVAVINRQRTREPRVAALLRALSDTALRFNVSFAAVHRAGVNNVLMDWASRPALHLFTNTTWGAYERAWEREQEHTGWPPLHTLTSSTLLNSRCVDVRPNSSTVGRWNTGGW